MNYREALKACDEVIEKMGFDAQRAAYYEVSQAISRGGNDEVRKAKLVGEVLERLRAQVAE